jgi:hypothetical protein
VLLYYLNFDFISVFHRKLCVKKLQLKFILVILYGYLTKVKGQNVLCLSNVYNMSGRVVSDIQTRAEGESLYIRYNTDANVVNNLTQFDPPILISDIYDGKIKY